MGAAYYFRLSNRTAPRGEQKNPAWQAMRDLVEFFSLDLLGRNDDLLLHGGRRRSLLLLLLAAGNEGDTGEGENNDRLHSDNVLVGCFVSTPTTGISTMLSVAYISVIARKNFT